MLTVYETAALPNVPCSRPVCRSLVESRDATVHWRSRLVGCFAPDLLFSGSLYLVALAGIKWMGALTPLGGVSFISGWACVAWTAWRAGRPSDADDAVTSVCRHR